ncbi:hypothetical protein AWB70_01793 [Caballeronia cordobensis]|uniref:Integrase n=1 Tax=Caballeronia cordobensis TaxID=1353886 RepID=A0A158GEH6_CABCO|nr:hypothetical protein [Caballeronia cordobensis]SAL29780.1 hypothetical protein AWB70_01793 [Caballeronia cordobensis]
MRWAWAHGHVTANPVSVVDHFLPKQTGKKEHQPAMPGRDVPALVKKHVAEFKQGEATRIALLFQILTTARSGESAWRLRLLNFPNGLLPATFQ